MGNQVHKSRCLKAEGQPQGDTFFENPGFTEFDDFSYRHPLTNPLILESIFSNLDISELLQCRLVNSTWRNLIHKFLIQKVKEICFFPSYSSSEMKMFFGTRSCSRSKLKKFLSVMESCDNIPITRYLLQDVIPRDLLTLRFLQICGPAMKCLQIGFADDNHWEEFLSLTPNLEELNIFVVDKPRFKTLTELSSIKNSENKLLYLRTLTFTTRSLPFLRNLLKIIKNLTTVTIQVGPKHGDNTLKFNISIEANTKWNISDLGVPDSIHLFNAQFLWSLLSACPNLQTLSLDLKYRSNVSTLKILSLEETVRKSLQSLIVTGNYGSCAGKIDIFHEDFTDLCKTGWELKTLKWSSFLLASSSLSSFSKFLESQRFTLKKLYLPFLDLPCVTSLENRDDELLDYNYNNNYDNFVIPRMEKLEELTIQCLVPPRIHSWVYTFPMLKGLEVKKLYFSVAELEQLFPASNLITPCHTLRDLVIDFKMFSPEYLRRLFAIFPDVQGLCLHEPTVDVVKTLWELWPNLKKLHLGINTSNTDYNAALLGFQWEEQNKSKREILPVDGQIIGPSSKCARRMQTFSIHNLKGLEELYIHGPITASALVEILQLKNIKCFEITSPYKTQICNSLFIDGLPQVQKQKMKFKAVCDEYIKIQYNTSEENEKPG